MRSLTSHCKFSYRETCLRETGFHYTRDRLTYGSHTEGSIGGVRFRSSARGETTAARLHSRRAETKLYGGLRSCHVVVLSLALVDMAFETSGVGRSEATFAVFAVGQCSSTLCTMQNVGVAEHSLFQRGRAK